MKPYPVLVMISATALGGAGWTAPAAQHFVGQNRLTRLAVDGAPITGALAQNDIPAKQSHGVTERYWKLVELNGRPVPAQQQEPYFFLTIKDRRVHGSNGCNSFSGLYELNEAASRIRFFQFAYTMKICDPPGDMELTFHKALDAADNYSLTGDRLALRARTVPLARFEAVYRR